MNEIVLTIDGREVKAKPEMTILEAAQSAGISIPTLCHHEKLDAYGACRICTVEVEAGGKTTLEAACTRPVKHNIAVRTRTDKANKIRRVLLEELLAHAPDSAELQALGREYGAEPDRFEREPSSCLLCGMCVRYCAEVKKKNAVGFVYRGTRRAISFIPEIASRECRNCRECFSLCPTSALQAAYALMEEFAFTPPIS